MSERSLSFPFRVERPSRLPAERWQRWWLALSLPLLLLFIVPVAALLLRSSPAQLWAEVRSPVVLSAARVSLSTSLVSMALILLLGTPLAYALARRRLPGKAVIETLVDLPTVLPPSVAGLALLLTFGRRGLFGPALESLGWAVAFTPAAVILAQTFVAAPFYVRAAVLGFERVERELVEAAQLDGAGRLALLRYVILPLAWNSLLGGAMMSWARALGEFGATILFAGNFAGRTQTMPLAIYLGFEQDLQAAITLAVLLISLTFVVLLAVRLILRLTAR